MTNRAKGWLLALGFSATVWAAILTPVFAQVSSGKVTTAAPIYTTNTAQPLSLDTAGGLRVTCPDGTCSGGGGGGGTSSNFGAAFPTVGTAAGFSDGSNMVAARVNAFNEVVIGGGVASGATDSGNPVKVGGVFSTTLPTLSDGQRGSVYLTNRGGLLVVPQTIPGSGADGRANTSIGYSIAASASDINGTQFSQSVSAQVFNGTTWDRLRGDTTGLFTVGNVAAAAADSGNPVKVGGVFSTSLPSLTNGQRGNIQLSGNGLITPFAGATTPVDGLSNTSVAASIGIANSTSTALAFRSLGVVFNGTSWDRMRGDTTGTWTVAVPPTTQADTLQASAVLAASTNSTLVKNAPGTLFNVSVANNSGTIAYLKLYNSATAPTCGSGTPVARYIIPASTAGAGSNIDVSVGAEYTTGIGYCVTAGIADSDTTAVAASSYIVNIVYK